MQTRDSSQTLSLSFVIFFVFTLLHKCEYSVTPAAWGISSKTLFRAVKICFAKIGLIPLPSIYNPDNCLSVCLWPKPVCMFIYKKQKKNKQHCFMYVCGVCPYVYIQSSDCISDCLLQLCNAEYVSVWWGGAGVVTNQVSLWITVSITSTLFTIHYVNR